jgi:hypothetical protein
VEATPRVMTDRVDWAEYRLWNHAIAEEFFSGRFGDRPVYLDLEDDVCRAVAERAGYQGDTPRQAIVAATSPTLTVATEGLGTFSAHIEQLRTWRLSGHLGWPPFVGVLAFLSLVAEEMASSENFSARNYYGRLLRHLGEDPTSERLRHKLIRDFARQSHDLWEALNDWLLEEPTVRGYPTAYSFDYRAHIGRPISQALLREADRSQLLDLFAEWRFEPGHSIAPGVMRDLLGGAIGEGAFSGTLSRIAQQPDALERLAEVACAELAAWKGVEGSRDTAGLSLVGARRSRPSPALLLAPVVFDDELAGETQIEFLDEDGEPTRRVAGFVDVADDFGAHRVSAGLTTADLLAATVVVSSGARQAVRAPRVLVLLEHRPEKGRLEEVGRAQLGAEYVLLVREGQGGGVRTMLDGSARPGWEMWTSEQLRGVPDGWRGFTDVQLLAIPTTKRADLASLVPVGWTRLSVVGGTVLPGRHSFLRAHPPEIAASVVEARSVRAILTRGDSDVVADLGDVEDAAAWDLSHYALGSGMHRVTLLAAPDPNNEPSDGTEGQVLDSVRISLHDPDAPLEREIDPAFGHRLSDPLAVLGAVRSDEPECRGGRIAPVNAGEHLSAEDLPGTLDDIGTAYDVTESASAVAVAERVSEGVQAASCIETGAHLMRQVEGAPTAGGEAPWRCDYCGLEKYFPTSLWRVRRRRQRDGLGSALDATSLDLPPCSDRDIPRSHAELIEAVCTVRSGSWGDFSRLVAQVDDRPWATRETGRLYSALGLIDVERSSSSLEPVAWQVAPPVLVRTGDRAAVLMGWRSQTLVDELRLLAEADGGAVHVVGGDDGVPVVQVHGVEDASLDDMAQLLDVAPDSSGMTYAQEPSNQLAARLPNLAAVRAQLPMGQLPEAGLERYQVELGRWVSHDSGRLRGAFRSQRRGWHWWHVDDAGDVRIVDSRLGKWLAASDKGTPMLAYRQEHMTLLAHAACPLPGLYERAAVLCSGLPPLELEGHLLGYRNVPEEVARLLAGALEG